MNHCLRLIRDVCTALAVIVCLAMMTASLPVGAQPLATATIETQFREWLAGAVWPEAQEQGISRETFERAFAKVTLDWSLPELQPLGRETPRDDQHQAEFLSPGRYFPEAQFTSLSKTAGTLLKRWASLLESLERRYRVPREILVAIWGRESHFGRIRPKQQALRVLATQAFMGRRRDLYYPELLATLLILEQDHLSENVLLSSWAGAMGQPQLLPSKFLRYAVDEDGDGRRDIWNSVEDSLASIANYLHEHGWDPGRNWGREVNVPASVSCAGEGPRQGRAVREWARLGVTGAGGASLPGENSETTTFLLMPAGRFGPAFLVSKNFYVLKQYNESDLYAVFVGHLADRMRGGSGFVQGWTPIGAMKRSEIRALQERLQAQGYNVGEVDGLIGYATRTAIGLFQKSRGMRETCYPDSALIRAVRQGTPE